MKVVKIFEKNYIENIIFLVNISILAIFWHSKTFLKMVKKWSKIFFFSEWSKIFFVKMVKFFFSKWLRALKG